MSRLTQRLVVFVLTVITAIDRIARAFGSLAMKAVLHTRTDGQLACREKGHGARAYHVLARNDWGPPPRRRRMDLS